MTEIIDSFQDNSNLIAPHNYSFNFKPTLKPSQKIFDVDISTTPLQPVEFSVNTLNYRFTKRLERFKRERTKLPTNKPEKVKDFETMYQRHQHITFTIINYLQMLFNVIIFGTILYIFVKIIMVVKQDFRLKAQEHLEGEKRNDTTFNKSSLIFFNLQYYSRNDCHAQTAT